MTSVPWLLFAYGEQHISSALAGLINGATPLMTLVAILLVFQQERPTKRRIIGLAIGFVGVLVVMGVWQGLGAGTWLGIGACVVAISCLGSGLAYVLNFRAISRSDATTASTVTYLTPLIAVIAGAVLLDEHISWNQPVGGVLIVLGAATAQGLLARRPGGQANA